MTNTPSKTVAISRQRGSGGSYVGRAVAERLSLRYIDRQMLRDAAEYLQTHDPAEKIEPASSSWWARLGQTLALGAPISDYVPPMSDDTYEGELFEIEKKIIHEVVDAATASEPTVVVGRGAAQTLRGRTCVVSVFLHAPKAWRVDRVKQIYELTDEAAAQRMVNESDRARARFIKAMAGCDWTDVHNYDVAIDTAALGFDAAVDIIIAAMNARFDRRLLGDLQR
jgi:cytidylate kinase